MSVVKLKDGSNETVFTLKDVLEVIEAHMGYDFMRVVDDCFDQYDEIVAGLEQQIEEMQGQQGQQEEPDEQDL